MDLATNQFILEDLITPHTYVAAENAGEFRFLKVGPFATQDAWQDMLSNDIEAFSSKKHFKMKIIPNIFFVLKLE